MAILAPNPKWQGFDLNGDLLAGGKLYSYAAGTVTPLTTYTTPAGDVANANPVILDSRGEANVWLAEATLYKFVLKTAADVTIWTVDNVIGGQYFTASGGVPRSLEDRATDMVSVFDFMTVAQKDDVRAGTALVDVTAPLNTAFAKTGRRIWMPKGTYKITSNLTPPVCSGIIGEGDEATIIACAAGITKALALNATVLLAGFKLTGNSTTNAIGIVWGDTADVYACVENVYVEGFIGTTALGVQFKRVLKSSINDLSIYGCTKDALVNGTGGLPTTLIFNNLYIGASLGIGMDVLTGTVLTFNQSIFESNALEGMYIRPSVGDVTECSFNECWFEDNWADNALQYHIKVNPDARTARPIFNTVYFSGGARALHLTVTGAGATQAIIDNLVMPSAANQVVVDSGARGVVEYYGNTDPAITLTDTLGGLTGLHLPWIAWTPVFSSNIGNDAATFTATPTIAHARYRLESKMLFIDIFWSATLLGITPAYIQFTLPVLNNVVNTMYRPGLTKDNAIWEGGLFRGSGGNALLQYRLQQGVYTSGGAVAGMFSGCVELS